MLLKTNISQLYLMGCFVLFLIYFIFLFNISYLRNEYVVFVALKAFR